MGMISLVGLCLNILPHSWTLWWPTSQHIFHEPISHSTYITILYFNPLPPTVTAPLFLVVLISPIHLTKCPHHHHSTSPSCDESGLHFNDESTAHGSSVGNETGKLVTMQMMMPLDRVQHTREGIQHISTWSGVVFDYYISHMYMTRQGRELQGDR